MSTCEVKLALFDFDGTLCPGDSIVPYLRYCIRKGVCPSSQLFRAAGAFLKQKLHPEQVALSKSVSLSFIRGKSRAQMDELARAFVREKLAPRFYAEGVQRIRELKAEGYLVWIISASPEVYMRVLPEFLPVDEVLATRCLLDAEDRYTAVIPANCRGEEKLVRLDAQLKKLGIVPAPGSLLAFGDSSGDVPMLRRADRAFLIHPDRKLLSQVPSATSLEWK